MLRLGDNYRWNICKIIKCVRLVVLFIQGPWPGGSVTPKQEYSLEPNKQWGILLTGVCNSTYIFVYILSRTKQHNRESERDREIPAKSVLALTSRLD